MKYKIRHTLYCHKNMKSFILVSTDKYNNKISTGSCYNIKEYFTLQQSSFSYFPTFLTYYNVYEAETIEELKMKVVEYLI